MKKLIINFSLFLLFLLISIIVILSTIGFETNKFNKLISDKTSQAKNIYLKLDTIKFKINLRELNLFLDTKKPEIIYKEVSLPTQNIKVFIDFISLLKSDPKIEKIIINLEELDITQLNKLSTLIKPSNFKSLINNNIKKGKLISQIEIFLTEKEELKDFIARGVVKDFKVDLSKNLNLENFNFKFFADRSDILVKNIFGDFEDIEISEGDIKLNLENGIKFNTNFNSKLNFENKDLNKFSKFFNKHEYLNYISNLKADFNNNLSINLDNTYKVKDYNYDISGNIEKSKIQLLNSIKTDFIMDEIEEVYLSDLEFKTNLSPKIISIKGKGQYSLNNLDFSKINIENNLKDDLMNLRLNFDFISDFAIDLINYKKPKNSPSSISLDFKKKKHSIYINEINYKEGNNSIKINGLAFKKNEFLKFKKADVSTLNNNFVIQNEKKIIIKGEKFDATNLAKFLSKPNDGNRFKNINSDIEIDFKNIKAPKSENIKNFKLIGEIHKGKFVKISSKGDYGDNNFLDISMKKDIESSKKYLEIYSDLTHPLLTEFSFFKGLSGGKLLFTSIIDGAISNSNLKIENFKVINAPGLIKLLSLTDLSGLEDLAKREGLTFDLLEINMEKNKDFLKLNEILALGPSMSVLMEGYQSKDLTSLRGTLVPAKTLNTIISKIPVIGKIVIPKEVGEGLFGISFKMKGPKDNIKTTINPLRTLTPRFIQKIIDRNKSTK